MHETRLRVRWSELDPYGHVNHAAYLTYLEHARIAALESIGWGMGEIERLGCRGGGVRGAPRFRPGARGVPGGPPPPGAAGRGGALTPAHARRLHPPGGGAHPARQSPGLVRVG